MNAHATLEGIFISNRTSARSDTFTLPPPHFTYFPLPQSTIMFSLQRTKNLVGGGVDLLDGDGALTEVVLELAVHVAQVAHAPGSRSASALALHAPVKRTLARRRVPA